ncbi:MAG: riboflavin kinase, partial [Kiritimatiellaeota bacterium]|nr:riboflavin kinase [Kiritimatiellota bacterium]
TCVIVVLPPPPNFFPPGELPPPFGFSPPRTGTPGGGGYDSISNFGTSPTFGGGGPTLETHLLNYGEGGAFGLARHSPFPDLYGQHIEVAFLKRIRDEQAFASPADLAEQIQRDIVLARQFNVNDSVGKNK